MKSSNESSIRSSNGPLRDLLTTLIWPRLSCLLTDSVRALYDLHLTFIWPLYDLQLTSVGMTFSWPLWDLCITFSWPLYDLQLTSIDLWMTCSWPLCDLCITCIWALYDLQLTSIWPSADLCVTSIWPSYDLCMTSSWPLCDLCVSVRSEDAVYDGMLPELSHISGDRICRWHSLLLGAPVSLPFLHWGECWCRNWRKRTVMLDWVTDAASSQCYAGTCGNAEREWVVCCAHGHT